jgi:hypothetical protein
LKIFLFLDVALQKMDKRPALQTHRTYSGRWVESPPPHAAIGKPGRGQEKSLEINNVD